MGCCRMGVAPWQHTQCSASSGKKGRNVAVDSMQSMRGGSVDVASARVGQHEKVSAVQVPFVCIERAPIVCIERAPIV